MFRNSLRQEIVSKEGCDRRLHFLLHFEIKKALQIVRKGEREKRKDTKMKTLNKQKGRKRFSTVLLLHEHEGSSNF